MNNSNNNSNNSNNSNANNPNSNNPNINLDISNKLEDLESSLLLNSFSVQHDENICVSELFEESDIIDYYYDIKIFKFGNKNVFMFFDSQEGYYTTNTIIFYDKLIILPDNQDKCFADCYSIHLLESKSKEDISINRLSKENYDILHEWIRNKL